MKGNFAAAERDSFCESERLLGGVRDGEGCEGERRTQSMNSRKTGEIASSEGVEAALSRGETVPHLKQPPHAQLTER